MASLEGPSACSQAARELGDLLASIEVKPNWHAVEINAQSLANGLRIRGGLVDEHTLLGKTLLPQTLTSLLKTALEGLRIPDDVHANAVFELLRVGANLCMDHNDNRGHLLDAGFPQLVVSLLEGYTETVPDVPSQELLDLPIIHLSIVRTAIGALLNLSLGYEPVQERLIALEVPSTLFRLSVSIYPPGAWMTARDPIDTSAWLSRKGISEWSWRTISGLKDNRTQQPLFGARELPALVLPLKSLTPPFPVPTNSLFNDVKIRAALHATDIENLEESCELLESLAMDVEDVRQVLAQDMAANVEPNCFAVMLDFIESGEYTPGWPDTEILSEERTRWKRAVELCKTAIIKAVVETSGEDANLDILWQDAIPNNSFVARMIEWLQDNHNTQVTQDRDDLVICASLSLGNLVRRDKHSAMLVEPPISITPHLVKYLTPTTDHKVKHGVVALLKHLAQHQPNRSILGKASTLEALRTCNIFNITADIFEMVQMSAINLTKHLCTNNVPNSITCVLDEGEGWPSSSCLRQILALSHRSDSLPVKSEGARVLVNAVKSLCSAAGSAQDERRKRAIKRITAPESSIILTQLLGRSKRHVILLNEAVVSLTLLAVQSDGAAYVLESLVAELPKEASAPSRQNSISVSLVPPLPAPEGQATPDSPAAQTGPSTALDMLVLILENSEGKFPPQLQMNICMLLGEVGKRSLKDASGELSKKVEILCEVTRPCMEKLKAMPDSLALNDAARKVLETW